MDDSNEDTCVRLLDLWQKDVEKNEYHGKKK